MTARKISGLTPLTTPAPGDYLPIIDISEVAAANKNKRITIEDLMRGAPNGTVTAPGIAFEGDPNTGIYSPGADQVAISTNGTGRLFVNSSGKVGLGSSAPSTLLHLSSATGSASPTPTELRIATTSTGEDWSTTNPWGRVSFYSADTSGSGPKSHAAIDCISAGTGGGASSLDFKVSGSDATLDSALRIDSTGNVGVGDTGPDSTLTIKAATGVTPLRISGPSSEFARVDSSGRLLVGTSSAYLTNAIGNTITSYNQVAGTAIAVASTLSTYWNDNVTGSAVNQLAKSRGGLGTHVIVQSDDRLGAYSFGGSDGTRFIESARIEAAVDGTPGLNDMPGRLVFSTTANGASSPTERMRIKSSGIINFSNTPVYADNAAATTGGLAIGDVYRTSTGQLMIRY